MSSCEVCGKHTDRGALKVYSNGCFEAVPLCPTHMQALAEDARKLSIPVMSSERLN